MRTRALSSRFTAGTAGAAVVVLALVGCGRDGVPGASRSLPPGQTAQTAIAGAGSTAQSAAAKGWIAGHAAGTVYYDPVGSSGGREQFISGGVAFAGTDSALKDAELEAASERCGGEVLELPLYVSPIAVVYNLPGVDDLRLSPGTIARVFDQQITRWNDPALVADNPGTDLPSTLITPVNRADGSGTTSNFTDYLSKAAPDAWPHGSVSDWPVDGGEQANGNAGVVQAVDEAEGSIGYADEGQADGLSLAAVKVGDSFVAPTPEAAAALVDVSPPKEGRSPGDLALDLDRTSTTGYPIVLVTYTVACADYADDAVGRAVRAFLSYAAGALGQQDAARAAGSAPLSPALAQRVADVVSTIA